MMRAALRSSGLGFALVCVACGSGSGPPVAPTAAASTASAPVAPVAPAAGASAATAPPVALGPLAETTFVTVLADGQLVLRDLALDNAGNTLIPGFLRGAAGWGATQLQSRPSPSGGASVDAMLAALDASLRPAWVKLLGGPGQDEGRAVAAGEGHVFAGTFAGSMDIDGRKLTSPGRQSAFVLAFEPGGSLRFARAFGGKDYAGTSAAAIDRTGGAVIAGAFEGIIHFDRFPLSSVGAFGNAFVAKLDREGRVLWAKSMTGRHNTDVAALAVGPKGDVFVLAHFDADSQDAWMGLRGKRVGWTSHLMKFTANGKLAWLRSFRGENQSYAKHIALSGEDVLATVAFDKGLERPVAVPASEASAALMKFSADGEVNWVRPLPGAYGDTPLAVGAKGDIVLGGGFRERMTMGATTLESRLDADPQFAHDAFVALLSPEGEPRALRGFFTKGRHVSVSAVAVRPSGAVVAMGSFDGEVDLGRGPMTSSKDPVTGIDTSTFFVELKP